MPSGNDNTQQPRGKWMRSATIILLALNVGAFVVKSWLAPDLFHEKNIGLSLSGIQHGYVWELLTYQFMHGSWPHLILNCWALLVVGLGIEYVIGKTRFLVLYFTSGIIGGLFQILSSLLWPQYFGGADTSTVGASASVFGVVAAFAMLYPDDILVGLLFFVIPVKMRAKSLLWFVLFVTALGISFPLSRLTVLLGGHVAHAAHLGGILTGIAFSRFYLFKFLPTPESAG